MADDVWTEQQKAYLLAERAKGTPVPLIAAALGKRIPATYTRCRMLGNRVQVHTPWTADLEARLRDLATGSTPMSDQELADAVGKTVAQMRWKLADLALVGARTKRPKRIAGGGRRTRSVAASDAEAAASRAAGIAAREAARLARQQEAEASAREERERKAAARAAAREFRAIAAKAAAAVARNERMQPDAQAACRRNGHEAEIAPGPCRRDPEQRRRRPHRGNRSD